jgi:hypothetical protein
VTSDKTPLNAQVPALHIVLKRPFFEQSTKAVVDHADSKVRFVRIAAIEAQCSGAA